MTNECDYSSFACLDCEYQGTKAQIEAHDCLKMLLQSKKRLEMLAHKYTSDKSSVVYQAGHPLGLLLDGNNIQCRSCNTCLQKEEGYFGCAQLGCSINLCVKCMNLKPIECGNRHKLSLENSTKITLYQGGYYG